MIWPVHISPLSCANRTTIHLKIVKICPRPAHFSLRFPKSDRLLAAIDTAEEPGEVGLFPGWRLHPLKGNLKGFWSVTISGNWRVVFRFEKGDAHDLDLIDYH